jgi:hypothetical protein
MALNLEDRIGRITGGRAGPTRSSVERLRLDDLVRLQARDLNVAEAEDFDST